MAMSFLKRFMQPFSFAHLDQQIEKFRQLSNEYKKANRAYYGEYLSNILFDQ